MEQSQLTALSENFRGRREHNRTAREKQERAGGLRVLALGLIAGVIVAGLLYFATR